MLTRILHNSDPLHSFFNELGLDLSLPQRQHMINMADALLVCEDTKTLAALQRRFVQAPDASNMADFLRFQSVPEFVYLSCPLFGGASVFFYIEAFYNRKRRHSTLGYLNPIAFEEIYFRNQSVSSLCL